MTRSRDFGGVSPKWTRTEPGCSTGSSSATCWPGSESTLPPTSKSGSRNGALLIFCYKTAERTAHTLCIYLEHRRLIVITIVLSCAAEGVGTLVDVLGSCPNAYVAKIVHIQNVFTC